MKFNFGHGVFIGASAFVVFIFFLVYNMLQQDIDLVAEDYYEEGLNYQQKIDEAKQAFKPNIFTYHEEGGALVLTSSEKLPATSCVLEFYRPSSSSLDFQAVSRIDSNTIRFEDTRMQSGLWKLTIRWHENDHKYYSEIEVILK